MNYTVQEGEDLNMISKKFDVPVNTLKTNNRLNTETVKPGDFLVIKFPDDQPIISTSIPSSISTKIIEPDYQPDLLTKHSSQPIFSSSEQNINSSFNEIINDEGNLDSEGKSIHAALFDPNNIVTLITPNKGILFINNHYLTFNANNKTINIPLLSHVTSAIMPHPCNFQIDGDKTLRLLTVSYLIDCSDTKSVTTLFFTTNHNNIRQFLLKIIETAQSIQRENHFIPPPPPVIEFPEYFLPPDDAKCYYRNKRNQKPQLPKENLHTTNSNSSISSIKISLLGGTSNIMNSDHIEKLRICLPHRFTTRSTWSLLYNMSVHGVSRLSFFKSVERQEPVLFLLKTNNNDKFGAFLPNGIKLSQKYYGSGETFLFKIEPEFTVYNWSRKNTYFISATYDEILIGGGTNCAIWIDDQFLKGFSHPCETFDSPQLTKKNSFSIVECEVWKIGKYSPVIRSVSYTNLWDSSFY